MKKIIKIIKKINHTFYTRGLMSVVSCVCGLILVIPFITSATESIDDAFGVNIHLRNRITEDNWDQALSQAKASGVDWAREEFDWNVIEPTDDSYNWEQYDVAVDKYNEQEINVLGLITYSATWASSNPGSEDSEYYAPDLTAWKDYVSTVATRYAGKVDYWEIWNEPNYDGFWKDTDAQYVAYLEEASKAIKAANPNAKIVLGGLSGADVDFLDYVYSQTTDKNYFDVIAIHPYRVIDNNFNYNPEDHYNGLNDLYIDLVNIRTIAKNNGDKDKPIWLTEFGWTTYDDGVSETEQANYLMRSIAISLSVPKVEKVFWYNFRDDADNTSYYESNFGLVKNDFTAKESLDSYNFLSTKLNGKKYIQSTLVNPVMLDDFNSKTGWQFSGTVNADGTLQENQDGLMKIYYDFNGEDNSYIPINREIKMQRYTKALSFKAKGSNDTTYLRVRLKDAKGEIFQYNLGYLPKSFLTYRIDFSNFSANWNGNKDGKIDYPVYFQSFILDDNPDGAKASGYVYFDDLQTSKKGSVYLYKYKQNKKIKYLIWTKGKSKKHKIELTNANNVIIRSLNKNNAKKLSGHKLSLRVGPQPKLIQVKN